MTSSQSRSALFWFLTGVRGIFSIPAVILMSAFVGFTGFAIDAGFPVNEILFMTGTVWALPGKVVLVGSVLAGASLPATFLAVTLSSIRLMPMVASLVPELRSKNTPTWLLLLLSHFVAVTAWVFTMERIAEVPQERRAMFFAGFGSTLLVANLAVVLITYTLVSGLPELLAGALFFLTPVYFLTSIWASARDRVVYFAMLVGLVLGPVFHQIDPQFDLLYAGIVGGTIAFAIDRFIPRGEKPS